MLRPADSWKYIVVSEVMALMMEALRMFETSVNFCDATWCNIILAAGLEVLKRLFYFNETTMRYITEGCHLHIRRLENVKSRTEMSFLFIACNVT
jgi:hypothetical protein